MKSTKMVTSELLNVLLSLVTDKELSALLFGNHLSMLADITMLDSLMERNKEMY